MPKYRLKAPIVEAHRHSGSSTDATALRQWVEGGEYKPSAIHTRDISAFALPSIDTELWVHPGDWVIKDEHGHFYVVAGRLFIQTYEEVEGE